MKDIVISIPLKYFHHSPQPHSLARVVTTRTLEKSLIGAHSFRLTSEREKLRVDILKRVLGDEARGTLRFEATIHPLYLILREPGCLAECR
jgi:hypothetical protein